MLGAETLAQLFAKVTFDLGLVGVRVATAKGLAVHVDAGFEEVDGDWEAASFGASLGHRRMVPPWQSRKGSELARRTPPDLMSWPDSASHSHAPHVSCLVERDEETLALLQMAEHRVRPH